MAKEPFALRGFARGGSRGQGQGHRRASQELIEEVQNMGAKGRVGSSTSRTRTRAANRFARQ